MGVEGVSRREGSGEVSAGALVGKDLEVELREEAGEVGEGVVGRGGEGFDLNGGADLDWVFLEEGRSMGGGGGGSGKGAKGSGWLETLNVVWGGFRGGCLGKERGNKHKT